MFFSTLRNAVRRRREAELDRDFWKAKAQRLEAKLEERSDFFIEREMRIIDRHFTRNMKTYAITDEIRAKAIETNDESEKYALEAFLQDKKEFLVDCAREAGEADPQSTAERTFSQNYASYVIEFQQQRVN